MKKILLLLSWTACCFSYQSLKISGNASVNLKVPSVTPFRALGDYRIAFRLHDWSLPASGQVTILDFVNARVVLTATGQLCGVGVGDTQSWGNTVCVTVSGLKDVVGRVQRFSSTYPVHDPMPGSSWFEAQDLDSGKGLTYSCGNWTPTGCPIDVANARSVAGTVMALGGGGTYSLGWLKWFSTTVGPNSGMENEGTAADLGDWRFEGNYEEDATGGYGAEWSVAGGAPTFVGSPVKGPACNVSRQILRAGVAGQLSSNAYGLDGSGVLKYQWQQLIGPTQLEWSGAATSAPVVSGGVFGSYEVQLTVQDGSGQTSSCKVKDGFVATDGNGVVVSGNPQVDELLGPQIQLGRNPWSWYDDRHVAEAELQIANLTKYYSLGGRRRGM